MTVISRDDELAYRAVEFDEWSRSFRWTWNSQHGQGHFRPKNELAIQHSFVTVLSIQHGNVNNPPSLPFRRESEMLFTTEKFAVCKTPGKGYGAFAIRDLEIGELVISEQPLLKTTPGTFFAEFDKLSRDAKADFDQLYGWEMLSDHPALAKFMTNRFALGQGLSGIFPRSSRFNHACLSVRNCTYQYNQGSDLLEVTALRPIKEGEEMTITYNPVPKHLYENYGFNCDCSACIRSEKI